jgi:hypothetical protein
LEIWWKIIGRMIPAGEEDPAAVAQSCRFHVGGSRLSDQEAVLQSNPAKKRRTG